MENKVNLIFVVALSMVPSVWAADCCDQGKIPQYQNITIAAIRLMSNSLTIVTKGRVEIQQPNGVWGTICPTKWTDSVASISVNVTCAMLGFRYGGQMIPNTFGDGDKNFLIENVTCPSNATSWYQCNQTFIKTCGSKDEELAVECYPDPNGSNFVQLTALSPFPGSGGLPPFASVINTVILTGTDTATCTANPNARLISGDIINSTVGNGYVQVKVNGAVGWSFICGTDSWNEAAAKVACRELCYESTDGFPPLPGIIAHSVPDQVNVTSILPPVNCRGNESSILDCPLVKYNASCPPGSPLAGVQCRPDCAEKPIPQPDVNCSSGFLVANFSHSKFPLITVNNIYPIIVVPSYCINVTSTPESVIVVLSLASGCDVRVQQNSTHITYKTQIRLLWVSGAVVVNDYINARYDLVCSVAKVYTVTNRLQLFTLAPNITIYQQYNFSLSMELYTNCNFTQPCVAVGSVYLVQVGDWLDAAITIDNYDSRTKLIITDCDAYPVMPFSAYAPVVTLIKDKCPVDSTLTMYSLDNRRQGFQVKAFMFAGYSMVYIRCSVNICLLDSNTDECDRACKKPATGRRKRAASAIGSASVNTKTIFIYDPQNPEIKNLLGAIGQDSPTPNTPSSPEVLVNQITQAPNAGQQIEQPGIPAGGQVQEVAGQQSGQSSLTTGSSTRQAGPPTDRPAGQTLLYTQQTQQTLANGVEQAEGSTATPVPQTAPKISTPGFLKEGQPSNLINGAEQELRPVDTSTHVTPKVWTTATDGRFSVSTTVADSHRKKTSTDLSKVNQPFRGSSDLQPGGDEPKTNPDSEVQNVTGRPGSPAVIIFPNETSGEANGSPVGDDATSSSLRVSTGQKQKDDNTTVNIGYEKDDNTAVNISYEKDDNEGANVGYELSSSSSLTANGPRENAPTIKSPAHETSTSQQQRRPASDTTTKLSQVQHLDFEGLILNFGMNDNQNVDSGSPTRQSGIVPPGQSTKRSMLSLPNSQTTASESSSKNRPQLTEQAATPRTEQPSEQRKNEYQKGGYELPKAEAQEMSDASKVSSRPEETGSNNIQDGRLAGKGSGNSASACRMATFLFFVAALTCLVALFCF